MYTFQFWSCCVLSELITRDERFSTFFCFLPKCLPSILLLPLLLRSPNKAT